MKANFKKFKEEIVKRCKEQNACKPEFKRILDSGTFPEIFTVLKDNFKWAIEHTIIDAEILATVITEANKSEIEVSKIVTYGNKSNTGDRNTGDRNTGYRNTGYMNTGDMNTGDRNTGCRNTGYRNTGDMNTGDMNTGDMNTGDMNTGDRNTGYRNTGYMNTGDRNTGYRNTGDRNTGDMNTGYMNTGDMNTTNYSCGIFNTIEQHTPIFNGAFNVLMSEFKQTDNYRALFQAKFFLTEWVAEPQMSDHEKSEYPWFYVQEGYLKRRTFQEACSLWWSKTTDTNKQLIQEIPGFSKAIFKEVTGIEL